MNKKEVGLVDELASIIEETRVHTVAQVNSSLTLLFWKIGTRINEFVLRNKRAHYGKQIVVTVSRQLQIRFGRNFEEKNLRRMLQFADLFPNPKIVVTVSRQLSWSHILVVLPLKSSEERDFYINQVVDENLGVRGLREQIEKKAFERTSIANKQLPSSLGSLSGNFKDPYFLDFLDLPRGYLENDLEEAILKELEKFILEVGKGFAFVERQKRMIIDGEDYHLDLLFFHRKLKRLVAIELKIGKFQAKYKGQMELYLKWLAKYEKQEDELPPIGLILCAETSREQIELLEMHKDGIIVAEYWTELPSKKELEKKLHIAYLEAKESIENKKFIQ
jgi:predicted nuclease of restriction endonuclease-like (RecB) superfamily